MDTPKEILIKAINNYLIDRLGEYGFSFSESSLKITRSKGDFINEISFRGSKTNISNQLINFQESFNIYSSFYKKWHKQNFPELPLLGAGYLNPDPNEYWVKYNKKLQPSFGYDFIRLDHRLIMDDLYNNITNIAIPYFDENDAWDKIATNTVSNGIQKLDALIISDRITEAKDYCTKSIELFEKEYGDSISGNAQQIQTYFIRRRDLINNNYSQHAV
jgi:hypothetical protein